MKYRIRRFSKQQRDFSWISKKLDKLRKEVEKEEQELKQVSNNYARNRRLRFLKQENDFIEGEVNPRSTLIDRLRALPNDNTTTTPFTLPPSKKDYLKYKEILEDEMKRKEYTVEELELMRVLMESNKEGKDQIFWSKPDGLETLAHEVGHILNRKGNVKDRLIRQGHKFGNKWRDMKPGVLFAILDILGSKFINWEEENASKKGYELLKKYKLTEEELKIAKENLDNALRYYKLQGDISWKNKILNSFLKKL